VHAAQQAAAAKTHSHCAGIFMLIPFGVKWNFVKIQRSYFA
jgi:hypothetical protein